MTIANVSRTDATQFSEELMTAQEAIHLPEVQEMLHQLAKYKLGIFMPHTHEERSGEFQPLPDELTQVESGLGISFQPTAEIANHTNSFIPVGWFWRAGASAPVSVCEMVRQEGGDGTEPSVKHKMPQRN